MWRPTASADPAARAARLVTVAATVTFALVVCRFQPWNLFVRESYSNDFYDEQARSFLRLRLAVRPEVTGQEGFVVDGLTYLYYGPFLAFARLPFALFGDVFAGRLARVSMIGAFVAYCTGCAHLVRAVARRWGGAITPWRLGGFVAAAACSPVLFLAGWVSVYHETELWAAVFAVWSFVGVLRIVDTDSPTRRHLLALGAPLAAGILTRASVGIGVAAGVCAALLITFWSRTTSVPDMMRDQDVRRVGAMAVGSSAVAFGVHAALNWAKFGSPTELPGQLQQLSIDDPARAAWFAGNGDSFFSPSFLETTVVHYLRPDTVRFERLFPFVRYGPLATDRGSYPLETITPSASLTTSATLLVALALVGTVLAFRARAWPLLALTAGGIVATVPTFTIGFIGNRYLVDMLPMLLVPGALAVATIGRSPSTARWAGSRPARVGVVALVAWGSWCNVSLALWTQQLKEPGFTEWRYRVDDWVFGDPPPALIDLVVGAPVPRDGVVVIDGDAAVDRCSAVYIAEQGRFVALERSNDGRRLAGTATIDGDRTLLAGGDNWSIVALGTPPPSDPVSDAGRRPEVRLEVTVDPAAGARGGIDTVGEPVAIGADGTFEFEIVADPFTGELSATVDGSPAAFVFAGPTGATLPGRTVTVDADPGDSLCRQLQARR